MVESRGRQMWNGKGHNSGGLFLFNCGQLIWTFIPGLAGLYPSRFWGGECLKEQSKLGIYFLQLVDEDP